VSRRPSYHENNKRELLKILTAEGYESHWLNEYQVRIMGATHVIDIWTPRMVHHVVAGEQVKSEEPYHRVLCQRIIESEVIRLLETGSV